MGTVYFKRTMLINHSLAGLQFDIFVIRNGNGKYFIYQTYTECHQPTIVFVSVFGVGVIIVAIEFHEDA